MSCSICKYPARGQCPVTHDFFCSSICQRIGYKLIGPKNERDEEEEDPNQQRTKKGKEKEEEEEEALEPFTQEKISDIPERDRIVINNSTYSLPELYRWTIDMGRRTNPLTGIEFAGEDALEQIRATARERYPLEVRFETTMGRNLTTRQHTFLSTIESLAFRALEVTSGKIADTIMEFMQTIVRENFMYFVNNRNILHLVLEHQDERIIDLPNIQSPLLVLFSRNASTQSQLSQINLCIQIARERGKGYDMFERRSEQLRGVEFVQIMTLHINNQEYNVTRENNESRYDAFNRVFNERYVPPTRHHDWITTTATVDNTDVDVESYTPGLFPLDQDDFIDLNNLNRIVVRVRVIYKPPTINVTFYTNNRLVGNVFINPERMLDQERNLMNYARTIQLPVNVPRGNRNVRITIFWGNGESIETSSLYMLDENIIFQVLTDLMSQYDNFNVYAGPANDAQIIWTVRVDVD